jgi:hypothetical protein
MKYFVLKNKFIPFCFLFILLVSYKSYAQRPLNDSCHNAKSINFGSDNFGIGVYESDSTAIDSADIQVGEWFHSSQVSSGNDKKSVWYKFYIPARRGVDIELRQTATAIAVRDVGFTTYYSDQCLPTSNQATAAKITTVNQIGSSSHPCLEPGWYMVQISAKSRAEGNVFLRITTSFPYQHSNVNDAQHDVCSIAYNFGTTVIGRPGWQTQSMNFQLGCYSLKDSSQYFKEIGNNYPKYTQLAWFKFKAFGNSDQMQFSLNEVSGYNIGASDTFAFRIFRGDCDSNLILLDSGISNFANANRCGSNYWSDWTKSLNCSFDSGKVYILQLLFHENYNRNMRLILRDRTSQFDTKKYQPNISNAHDLGLINANGNQNFGFSCNSRIKDNVCSSNTMRDSIRILNSPYYYTLNQWMRFSLSDFTRLNIDISTLNSSVRAANLAFRIIRDSVTSNCADVDTNNIVFERYGASTVTVNCLEPGNYAIQILGTDSNFTSCEGAMHLGGDYRLNWTYIRLPERSKFSLLDNNEVDTINNRDVLIRNTLYNLERDSISCNDAPMPEDICTFSQYSKAIYRTFEIPDSGLVRFSQFLNWTSYQGSWRYARTRLYKGDAQDLRLNQGISGAQDTIRDLKAWGDCFNANRDYCLEPGKYTIVTFADEPFIGIPEIPRLEYKVASTKFNNPQNANFIDTIKSFSTYYSDYDTFTCFTNPDTIDGVYCGKRNLYFTFYLDTLSTISIGKQGWSWWQSFSLFSGNIKDGKSGLKLVDQKDGVNWRCRAINGSLRTSECKPLIPGWYTVVVSNSNAIEYDSALTDATSNPRLYNVNGIGRLSVVSTAPTVVLRKYDRPYRAAYVDSLINNNQPLAHDTNYSMTQGMPQHKNRFTFPQDIIECDLDTPIQYFTDSMLCMNNTTDIVYYVFNLSKSSYAYINAGVSGGTWKVKMYNFDIRTDSALLATEKPIQDCNYDGRYVEFCDLKPGVYTLVYFVNRTIGQRVTIRPILTLDTVYHSRSDHAKKTYDFGRIPGDGEWHVGKIGEVHPADSTLPPSYDVITCKTGSQPNHPNASGCWQLYNPYIYRSDSNTASFPYDSAYYRYQGNNYWNYGNQAPMRNLWYSFTINGRGRVTVSLEGLTEKFISAPLVGLRWVVYESNSDGDIDLSTVIANGQFDSTLNGLTSVGNSYPGCCHCASRDVTFDISACDSVTSRRYVILVHTNNNYQNLNGNYHLWPKVKYDSFYLQDTKFDYYSTAGVIDGLTENNLVKNPGAEQNLSHWTATENATTTNNFSRSGSRSFYGNAYNQVNQISTLSQNINVGAFTDSIQNGTVTAHVSFNYLTELDTTRNEDELKVVLNFKNSSGQIIDSFETNWLQSNNAWRSFNSQQSVPINTTEIQVILKFKKNNSVGTWAYRYQYAYAYIDDVNLTLRLNNPPTQRPKLVSKTLYQGERTYMAGSTLDATDQGKIYNWSNCTGSNAGTVWYKFKVDSTGYLHYNMLHSYLSGGQTYETFTNSNFYIRLFKSNIDGDSIFGLQYVPPINTSSEFNSLMGSSSSRVCVSPGYYYIQINRCNYLRCEDFVKPQIVLDYARGDFCTTAEPIVIDTLEQQSASLLVNCHTIGESYGEDGSDMGCLFGPQGYKSSWFVVDYTDTNKVNLEFKLNNNTQINPSQIRYRTYYGNCAQLTSAPCNNNALTTFTLDCIRQGTYYVQVVTPENAIGTVDLSVEAKENTDTTCIPIDIFQPNAAFTYNTSCPENIVNFLNTSSRGDSIAYFWDFGYNGLTDTVLNPTIVYPPSNQETSYNVKLVVTHRQRGSRDSIIITINVPFTPELLVHSRDTNLCLGDSVTLTASLSHGIGYWNTLDTTNNITVNKTGWYFYKQIDKPNLLINGSGELQPSVGWTAISGTWVRRSSSPAPFDSSHYISANQTSNNAAGLYELTQEIDISFDSIDIDSGIAKTSLIGYMMTGNEAALDEGQIILEYQNAAGGLLAIYRSDFISSTLNWTEIVHSRTTPVGTRKLVVKLQADNKQNNSQCMVYFDGFQVKMRSACEYVDSVYVQINPIPKIELPIDTVICPNTELVIGPEIDYFNPYMLFDSLSGNPTSGTLYNNAFYNPNLRYVTLTEEEAVTGSGAIEWIDSQLLLSDTFDIEFEFFTKKRTLGTDGRSLYFYLFNAQTPTADNLSNGGYVISFNESDNNSVSVWWNGSRRIRVLPGMPFVNGQWNKVRILYSNKNFNIYLNEKLVMTFTDNVNRTQVGNRFGLGANTYSWMFSEHRIRNVLVTKNNDERVIITPPNRRGYTYNWSDSHGDSSRFISQSGLYKLNVTDGFGCVSNMDSIEITVHPIGDKILIDTPFICDQLDSFQFVVNAVNGFFNETTYIDSTGWIDLVNAQVGLNEVIFTFLDSNGCIQIDTGAFEKGGAKSIIFQPVNTLCQNSIPIQLEVNDSNGYFYGGIFIDSMGLFNPSVAQEGWNKVYYTTFDTICNSLDSLQIWVDTIPNIVIQPAGPFCQTAGVQVIQPQTSGGFFTNTTYIDSSGNFDPRISGAGNFSIYYNVTDGNGCSNIDSIVIQVDTIPNAAIQAAGPFCANEAAQTVSPVLNFGYFTNTPYIDSSGNFDPRISGSW